MTEKPVALTGLKPTGTLHLGNYIGAIRAAQDLAKDHQLYCFIADLHALNTHPDPKDLKARTLDLTRHLMALLPDDVVIYRQSDIPEISELCLLLAQVCPTSLLRRSHAYKAAREANLELEKPEEANINMGLAMYPLLMAADILGMNAEVVPVGPDQLSHHEIARDLMGSFHARYGPVFQDPRALVLADTSLPGLDGQKMSKSYDNIIPIFGPKRRKLCMKIKTDTREVGTPKTEFEDDLIYQIYEHFANPDALRNHYSVGGGYGDAKQMLAKTLELHFAESEDTYNILTDVNVEARLRLGKQMAQPRIRKTLQSARAQMGL